MYGKDMVLLIEDDDDLLFLTARLLERAGYFVVSVRSIREAWKMVREYIPQAIVLDVDLPDGSGFDFCREFKQNRDTPVLLLTGLDGSEGEAAGLAAGGSAYITKPYCAERLTESLSGLLAKRMKN